MTADDKSTPTAAPLTVTDTPDRTDRRDALIKIARWVPPVMVTLTLSQRASAESRPCPPEEAGTCPE